jgi:1-deoxy-D-xylulose-5-phosphate reductoisomerase
MKKIVILGSTGSIGQQTIEIVQRFPEKFRVIGISGRRRVDLLLAQARELAVKIVALSDKELASSLTGVKAEVVVGEEALCHLASLPEVDIVVNALVGSVGLKPTLAALKAGKTVALANKETMVTGGELVVAELERAGAKIIPIDSEHSAIFQCLRGESTREITKLIITGSGGPFRGRGFSDLSTVTVSEALAHPKWKMGPKITIDSATLMNKGLEVIEAHFLFSVSYERIKVVIHPESIVHSLVEFRDGSIKAQLGPTDMRLPIQYALSYPERFESPVKRLDLVELGQLTFEEPDFKNFPCLKYALEAAQAGGTYRVALNAANEEAVAAFLANDIHFTDIPRIIGAVLDQHDGKPLINLGILSEVEKWARGKAKELIKKTK